MLILRKINYKSITNPFFDNHNCNKKDGAVMIKGIRHQIIEVTDTNNKYYERALLVLRPEYASVSNEVLEREAKKMLKAMDTVSSAKPKQLLLSRILCCCLYCAIGVLSTVIFYTLI